MQVYPYMKTIPLDGQPFIRPLFWLEPDNQAVFKINDQFLVGDQIMVAPVLEPNATSRQIYIPTGKWFDPNLNCLITGPTLISNYSLKLETIPYFFSFSNQIMQLTSKRNNFC